MSDRSHLGVPLGGVSIPTWCPSPWRHLGQAVSPVVAITSGMGQTPPSCPLLDPRGWHLPLVKPSILTGGIC